jgi:hypothetical protein
MSQIDLSINQSVRRVLIRHWLDLGRLSIRSVNGAVTIRGSLQRIPGVTEELTSHLVETIFNEVNRVKDMRRLSFDLDNWASEGGRWVHTEGGRHKPVASMLPADGKPPVDVTP